MANDRKNPSQELDALDDMIRLLDLQDQVKELYAEIGRIKRRLKSTATSRAERRAELERMREVTVARERSLLDRADAERQRIFEHGNF